MLPILTISITSDFQIEYCNRKRFLRNIIVEQKYRDMERHKNRSKELLTRTPLPESVIKQIRETGMVESGFVDSYASVLFADIVSFTTFSQTVSAVQLVVVLNAMFTKFDRLAETHGVDKIKTIGDCYVAACGIFAPTSSHSISMIEMAISMHKAMQELNEEFGYGLRLRIGINSGNVMGGVMGRSKIAFDLWGREVELANEIEASGLPERIHVSESTFLRAQSKFSFEIRESVDVPHFGLMQTYLVVVDKKDRAWFDGPGPHEKGYDEYHQKKERKMNKLFRSSATVAKIKKHFMRTASHKSLDEISSSRDSDASFHTGQITFQDEFENELSKKKRNRSKVGKIRNKSTIRKSPRSNVRENYQN